MNDKQIDALSKIENLENAVEVIDLELLQGQNVLVASGPFKGIEAKIVRHNGKGKLLLSVEMIGKGVLLEIGRTKIEQTNQLSSVN